MSSQEKSPLLSEDKSLSGDGGKTSKETLLAVNGKMGLGAWALSKSGICSHRWAGRSYRAYILAMTFVCYMCYHMCKKPFSVVKIALAPNCSSHSCQTNHSQSLFNDKNAADVNGWAPFDGDHCETELAVVDYSWLFSYAIAMFMSGYIGDRVNLRYFLAIGMIGTGIGVGLLGVEYYIHTHQLWYFILVQVFSGAMQSTGWPGVVAVMGNWFGKRNRGLVMGIWNAHTSVGNILGTVVSSFWADSDKNWSWSFFVPAFIMIGAGIFIGFFLVPDPSDVGIEPPVHHQDQHGKKVHSPTRGYGATSPSPEDPTIGIEVHKSSLLVDDEKLLSNEPETSPPIIRKDSVNTQDHKQTSSDSNEAVGFFVALKIPGVMEYALALFFTKFVGYTFLVWLPFYVANQKIGGKCLDHSQADWLSTTFDGGGILGGILNGYLSDLLQARAATCAVLLVLSVPALFSYLKLGSINLWLTIGLLMVCGATVNGPYAVITTAVSSDLGTHKTLRGNKQAKATVSAIIDGTGSIGAAIGPLLTGPISDHFGWETVFYVQMAACVAAALLLSRLIVAELKTFGKFLKRKIWHSSD